MNKRLGILSALLIGSSIALGGCDVIKDLKKAKDELVGSGTAEKTADKEGPLSSDPDEALGLKLNHPIECINNASSQVSRSEDRYLSWVDPKTGPKGNERNVYGLYEVNKSFVDRCKKELGEFRKVKEPPTKDLDALADAYEVKLDAAATAVGEAHKYYSQKDYEDDKFAKAKTMHPNLVKAFQEFDVADKALRDEVSKLKSGMSEREIAKVEKDEGKKLRWHKLKIGIVAEKVLLEGKKNIDEIDQAKLEAATKELEDIVNQLEAYEKAHADEVSKVMMWSMYSREPVELVKSAKALVRRVRDQKPFGAGELTMINGGNPQMVEGHPAHLLEKYNDLVKAGNSLKL